MASRPTGAKRDRPDDSSSPEAPGRTTRKQVSKKPNTQDSLVVCLKFTGEYAKQVVTKLNSRRGTVRSRALVKRTARENIPIPFDKVESIKRRIIRGTADGTKDMPEVFWLDRARQLEMLKLRINELEVLYRLNKVTLARIDPDDGGFVAEGGNVVDRIEVLGDDHDAGDDNSSNIFTNLNPKSITTENNLTGPLKDLDGEGEVSDYMLFGSSPGHSADAQRASLGDMDIEEVVTEDDYIAGVFEDDEMLFDSTSSSNLVASLDTPQKEDDIGGGTGADVPDSGEFHPIPPSDETPAARKVSSRVLSSSEGTSQLSTSDSEATDVDEDHIAVNQQSAAFFQDGTLRQCFEALFRQPSVHHRAFKARVDSAHNDGHRYWYLGADGKTGYRSLLYIRKSYCTKYQASRICRDLTDFLNSFAGLPDACSSRNPVGDFTLPIYRRQTYSLVLQLARLSAARHVPRVAICLPQPIIHMGEGEDNVAWEVRPVLLAPKAVRGVTVPLPTYLIPLHSTLYDSSKDFMACIPPNVRFQTHAADKSDSDITRMKKVFAVSATPGGIRHESSLPKNIGRLQHLRDGLVRLESLARGLQATAHLQTMTHREFQRFASDWIMRITKTVKRAESLPKQSAPLPNPSVSVKALTTFELSAIPEASSPSVERSESPKKRSTSPSKRPQSPLKTNFEGKHAQIMEFVVNTYTRTCAIKMVKHLQDSIGGTIPKMLIKSLDKSRALAVAEVMSDTWMSTGDVLATSIAGAEMADSVNSDILQGVPSPSTYFCGSIADPDTHHLCPGCAVATLCSELELGPFNLRYCQFCQDKMRSGPEFIEFQVKARVRKALDPESMGGLDTVVSALMKQVDQSSSNAISWRDTYTGQMRQFMHQNTREPDDMSIDAIMAVGHSLSSGVGVHCPENLAITAMCLNFTKHIHLVALLEFLGTYSIQIQDLLSRQDTDPSKHQMILGLQQEMMRHCNELSAIRSLVPYSQRHRLEMDLSTSEISELLQLFRSGRMPTNLDAVRIPRYLDRPRIGRTTWRDEDMVRIQQIISEIEEEFDVELPTSDDGCPYFGLDITIPSDWNWCQALSVSSERLIRMRHHCNGLYTTIETPLTIFVEIIFIVCVWRCTMPDSQDGKMYSGPERAKLKRKYCEFLHLPITIWIHHPLCFALTKFEHGKRMATGFRLDAASLADRDESRNNLLVETQTSNYTKWHFFARDYTTIIDAVHNLKISSVHFDKSAEPLTLSDELCRKLKYYAHRNQTRDTVDLPSGFEDAYSFEMEEIGSDADDDDFEFDEDPADAIHPLLTRYDEIQNLISTDIPTDKDEVSVIMADLTDALLDEDVNRFDRCEELLRAQFEDANVGADADAST